MYTCYLFVDRIDDGGCLSIRLASDGSIDEPLALRTIDEFKKLQYKSTTIVVIPTELTSIFELEAPLLSARKARPVVSYALEEQLAEPVHCLHFVFDKKFYRNGKYLVVVVNKDILANLQNKLAKLHIHYDAITNDWFAVRENEACVVANKYLVNDQSFKGALSLDLFAQYVQQSKVSLSNVFKFSDSPVIVDVVLSLQENMDAYSWIATRLFKNSFMNFCQGDFLSIAEDKLSINYYKIASILGALWFLGLITTKLIYIFLLDREIHIYDNKIANIYRKFFPEARQVISPKFRVNQLLHRHNLGYHAAFWKLLVQFSEARSLALKDSHSGYILVEQIKYQNSILSIKIICSDFLVLEKIENNLQVRQVRVNKNGTLLKGDKVISILEIS